MHNKHYNKKPFMKYIISMFKWLAMSMIVAIAVYMVISKIGIMGLRTFVVQSGSMEPFIMTGDVIVVLKSENYDYNDVITYRDENNRIVTHRIVSKKDNTFITKGDANHAVDSHAVSPNKIIGKVIWHIPKLGYYVTFIKTPTGMLLLFLLPVFIFLSDELLKNRNAHKMG